MVIAICDDEKDIIDYIKDLLQNNIKNTVSALDIISFTNADGLWDYITNNCLPDAIIIDICIEQTNGIHLIKKLGPYIKDIPVIFITGYLRYCEDIFLGLKPWALLTKPIDNDKLIYHINNIVANFNYDSLSLNITNNGLEEPVKNKDIIYIESNGRKVIYHTDKKEYTEYIKLDDAMQKLKLGFLRCHKSYGVNMNSIISIEKDKVILKNNICIPISRTYKNNAMANFMEYKALKIGV